jgi:DNA-binding transcriptional ArsR family regulator
MSSGVGFTDQRASLRALAHPLRLRLLSLLTGAAMSAAEVARELDITHANASYHLRQLHGAGLLVIVEEQSIRGGRAKRYRHEPMTTPSSRSSDPAARQAMWRAVAAELVRRSPAATVNAAMDQVTTDAELWVDPEIWADVVATAHSASERFPQAARPPHTPGTIRASATIALFVMGQDPQ